MTEEEARQWIADRFGDPAVDRLTLFATLVREETGRQNLVSRATLDQLWARHLVDSAQLLACAPAAGSWLDIGSGAGFPGLVVAVLRPTPVLLAEPRRLRADFLTRSAEHLQLSNVTILAAKVEQVRATAAVISARAVASVEKLLHAARHCATSETRWILPRGRFGPDDLAALQQRWAGVFHVKQSVVDPASVILVADRVRPRKSAP